MNKTDSEEASSFLRAQLCEHSPVPHFALKRDGTIAHLNDAVARLLRTAPVSLLKSSGAALVAQNDRPVFQSFFHDILAGQTPNCRVTLLGLGGFSVAVRLEGRYLPELELCLVAALELSESGPGPRESMERAILKTINEQTGIVICVKDRAGRVLYLNPAMSRFLGKAPEDVLGACDLEPIADPEQVAGIKANDRRIMENGISECVEETGCSAAGPWTYLFTKSPLGDQDGKVNGIVGVGLDITSRKKAEERLKRYAQRLIAVEDSLRKQIARELHDDVGQELTCLLFDLAHIERMLGEEADAGLLETLENSRRLTKAIHRSVRSLMASLHPIQLEVHGLVMALQAYASEFQGRTGICVTLEAPPGFPRLPSERETALFRICQEALTNVLKHAEATGVSIALTSDAGCVRLCLSDDGIGLTLRDAAPKSTDSGWGLTIMRERAELTGGCFHAVSAPGKGTTIQVEYPDPS